MSVFDKVQEDFKAFKDEPQLSGFRALSKEELAAMSNQDLLLALQKPSEAGQKLASVGWRN